MRFVAGVDSSTQSTKVEIRDLDTGAVVGRGVAAHPPVTPPKSEQDPRAWFDAFTLAWEHASAQTNATVGAGRIGATGVDALSIAGQQHGMVVLDDADQPVRPAKLWNDTESAPDAGWLRRQLADGDDDGSAAWADAVGSVPVAAFTIAKLSWLHRCEPDSWSRIARVLLPHDYLTHRLTGNYVTDRGDASGTGYWSPSTGEYRWDLLEIVDGSRDWHDAVPSVLGPIAAAGDWNGITVGCGTGDNMAAALGVGMAAGDAVLSIGTSGTASTLADRPTADRSGAVAGFADATGRFLPLVCTSNAAKVIDAFARLLGVDHTEFDALALAAGTESAPILLPYLDGERTPDRPDSTGLLTGLRTDVSREQLARSAVDGVACGLLDALDALCSHAPVGGRLLLTGGGARSAAMQAVINGLVDLPVLVSTADEAVATGAAVQAAAVLEAVDPAVIQRRWGIGAATPVELSAVAGDLRARYAAVRDAQTSMPVA